MHLHIRTLVPVVLCLVFGAGPAHGADAKLGVVPTPNLDGQVDKPLRYRPDGADFVIENGAEFFNRPLYGGNSAFRVDGGDRPQFSLYLPGRGGNLRLGVRTAAGTAWLDAARAVTARYRPGELLYEIADDVLGARGRIHVAAVAYADTEGLGVEVRGAHLPAGAELVFAFGPGNGQRGVRGGDIGTERVPIGEYFQFTPDQARDTRIALADHGFVAAGKQSTIGATVDGAVHLQVADGRQWHDLAALLAAGAGTDGNVALARVALGGRPVRLALQVIAPGQSAGRPAELARRFAAARRHAAQLRRRVRIDTPDPWLNAAMGALNVAADAVWDEQQGAIMHGAIAWRTKLLGWRGPYALDALGWHARARRNFEAWTARQDTSPAPDRLPPADAATNLARNEAGLHTNGDMSHSHYDMNLVFVDALLRHLLWTGDKAYARAVWPVLERHLAWERRLFRRAYGPEQLPLYEAYAAIWASDDLYYSGGGTAHASAYNAWHNDMAARIAPLAGRDPAPYLAEADAIRRAMRRQLWMPARGAFAEYRDLLGEKLLHPSYGLWTFYHTIDARVPTPFEAARMAADLDRHLRPIPVRGAGVPADRPYHVLPSTDWLPYTWSINNVVMGENLHAALAYWQAGRGEQAFALAKGALLASMYMGISPGNVGTLNYLDVYRREAQRDFADGAGVMARALVEGLFGVQPDALAGVLTVRPGLPRDWDHASLAHPDLDLDWRRTERGGAVVERWTVGQHHARFRRLVLQVPAARTRIARVTVNGRPAAWRADADAVGAPRLRIEAPLGARARVEIAWRGAAPDALAAAPAAGVDGAQAPQGFRRVRQGDFAWWVPLADAAPADGGACRPGLPDWMAGAPVRPRLVDLTSRFNDRVTEIFRPGKYRTPRSPFVSLALPAQGIGAWAGHVNATARIDDTGLRAQGGVLALPNGLAFATPAGAGAANVAFASQWDNYPRAVTVPLDGTAARAFLLLAGSTNPMQSRIDNGEIVVDYADGTQARLALRNPDTWWPIEQDYFVDDYQFRLCAPRPLRVELKTARAYVPDAPSSRAGGEGTIDGGAATVLAMPLDPARPLKRLTVRALANDVVIGLMGITLDRPD